MIIRKNMSGPIGIDKVLDLLKLIRDNVPRKEKHVITDIIQA